MFREFWDSSANESGWCLIPSIIPMSKVEILRHEMQVAYTICRKAQTEAGIEADTEGSLHHLPAISPTFMDFLDDYPVLPYVSQFFGGKPFILNSMGGNMNFPGGNYASRVHRDIRSFWNDRMMLNTWVALDDTTPENGATWLLPGSHLRPEKPSDEEFDDLAIQVPAPAGSVLLWDSRVWHRAGQNKTDKPRRILTPIFTVPMMKQGFDYPRAIGYKRQGLSENLRQLLGYNSRVPASLQEWYAEPGKRMYLPGQG